MPTNAQRTLLVKNAEWLIANRQHIGYQQHRPQQLLPAALLRAAFNGGERLLYDCSMMLVQAYFLTGLHDPTGFAFNGDGNTESMLGHLPHYSEAIDAHPGAIVIFNADQPLRAQHCAMVTHPGRNPMLFSHGTNSGPGAISLGDLQTAFAGRTTFLDIGNL